MDIINDRSDGGNTDSVIRLTQNWNESITSIVDSFLFPPILIGRNVFENVWGTSSLLQPGEWREKYRGARRKMCLGHE